MQREPAASPILQLPPGPPQALAQALPTPLPTAAICQADVLQFLRAQPAQSIDLIVTDPAYAGLNQHLMLGQGRIVGRYQERGEQGKWFTEFQETPENYHAFLAECERVLKPDRHIFIMFDSFSLLSLGPLVRAHFNVKNIIVWDKERIGMGHYFRRQMELILFACKGRRPLSRRNFPDVWPIPRLSRPPYPTQKPVELFETMIAASKATGDAAAFMVCDPFAGSASAAIAALKQGVSFIGCDISGQAVLMARQRIAAYLARGEDPCQPCPVAHGVGK